MWGRGILGKTWYRMKLFFGILHNQSFIAQRRHRNSRRSLPGCSDSVRTKRSKTIQENAGAAMDVVEVSSLKEICKMESM